MADPDTTGDNSGFSDSYQDAISRLWDNSDDYKDLLHNNISEDFSWTDPTRFLDAMASSSRWASISGDFLSSQRSAAITYYSRLSLCNSLMGIEFVLLSGVLAASLTMFSTFHGNMHYVWLIFLLISVVISFACICWIALDFLLRGKRAGVAAYSPRKYLLSLISSEIDMEKVPAGKMHEREFADFFRIYLAYSWSMVCCRLHTISMQRMNLIRIIGWILLLNYIALGIAYGCSIWMHEHDNSPPDTTPVFTLQGPFPGTHRSLLYHPPR